MEGLASIKTLADFTASGEKPDYLFWVGCAGSFDPRAQRVTVAFAKILQKAAISFAILGNEEACTGDPARRAGNEFIFQMLALQNIQTLNGYAVTRIVAICPHCFNTLKNEYPELGGHYEVWHHTQLLKHLIDTGKLSVSASENNVSITYHDSCYLGRVNGEYDAPRDVLSALKADIREMSRTRSNGLCCGAGGAQMWKEEESGSKRINTERGEEALATGAGVIAVNCPFCLTMMSDSVKEKDRQDDVMVMDLSELIIRNNQW